MILSLPPWLRYKAENMLISMLIPEHLSAQEQKKFFDKVIEVEFNPLLREGFVGPEGRRLKVSILGSVTNFCEDTYFFLTTIIMDNMHI